VERLRLNTRAIVAAEAPERTDSTVATAFALVKLRRREAEYMS
jgi:hypothetical protein